MSDICFWCQTSDVWCHMSDTRCLMLYKKSDVWFQTSDDVCLMSCSIPDVCCVMSDVWCLLSDIRHLICNVRHLTFVFWCQTQRAKKVVSDSLGLVDFAIGLVNSVLNLPEWRFFGEVKLQKYCKTKCFKFLINSCGPKVAPTKWNLHKQDEVSHCMSDETYWDPRRKGKADIEKTLEVNVAPD